MLIIGSLYLVLYFQRRFCAKTTGSELVSRGLPTSRSRIAIWVGLCRCNLTAASNLASPFHAKCWVTIFRGPFAWKASSTAEAISMTAFECSATPAQNTSDEVSVYGVVRPIYSATFNERRNDFRKSMQPIRRWSSKPVSLRLLRLAGSRFRCRTGHLPPWGCRWKREISGTMPCFTPPPQRTRSWGSNGGVPDLSQTETHL
jgi:hypothetical protein